MQKAGFLITRLICLKAKESFDELNIAQNFTLSVGTKYFVLFDKILVFFCKILGIKRISEKALMKSYVKAESKG